jgi:polyhydroxyalkanoate synthesis regulator phasin
MSNYELKAKTEHQRGIEEAIREVADFWGEEQRHIDDLVEIGDIAVYAADTRRYVEGLMREVAELRAELESRKDNQ